MDTVLVAVRGLLVQHFHLKKKLAVSDTNDGGADLAILNTKF